MLKRIFNEYEKVTYKKLEEVCTNDNASVYPKVRLADVLSINNSGISNEEFSFALKAHFDFTVFDNQSLQPLFAVEFDGKFHRTGIQKKRDEMKNRLVERFGLPLLRINSLYLERKYRSLDLLSWCIEVWFSAKNFHEAQENGIIPFHEPFAHESISFVSGSDKMFPYFLSLDVRNEIRRLSEKKQIKGGIPNTWTGIDSNGNYYGISWLYLDNETGLFTTSGIKAQLFPISQSDLLEEIMISDLYEKLLEFFQSKRGSVSNQIIIKRFNKLKKKYRIASASLGGG